jgi:hypothetical protein
MFNLTWDKSSERYYETGTDRGVLFPMDAGTYGDGVAWSGITAVNQAPSGAEATAHYADNIKYFNILSNEDFAYTIEAFYYPDEFEECDGSASIATGVKIGQQKRKMFGFAYRSVLGNDTEGNEYGYKLHLIYGSTAAPSARDYATVNESTEPMTMSWECSTVPVEVTGHRPTAHIEIDSTKVDGTKLAAFEEILYGKDETPARLPLPDEVATLLGDKAAG